MARVSEEEARVSRQVPGWKAWRTLNFAAAAHTWSVMPDGASTAVYITDDPAEIVKRVRDCASWLPDSIREAQEKLDSLPAHWERERAAWAKQIEALKRAQQRAAGSLQARLHA